MGDVVITLKGRDKNRLMCVIGVVENGVLVCDGKERKKAEPKLKNSKHIKPTGKQLSADLMVTDKAIRKALKLFSEA